MNKYDSGKNMFRDNQPDNSAISQPNDGIAITNSKYANADTASIIADLMKDSPIKSARHASSLNMNSNNEILLAAAPPIPADNTSNDLLNQFAPRRQNDTQNKDRTAAGNTNSGNRNQRADQPVDSRAGEPNSPSNWDQTQAYKNRRNRLINPEGQRERQPVNQPVHLDNNKSRFKIDCRDKQLDQKLAACKSEVLAIDNLPKDIGIKVKSDKNGYYFYYVFLENTKTGPENLKHHYIPPTVTDIEASGVRRTVESLYNPTKAHGDNKNSAFGSISKLNGIENLPLMFGERLGQIADEDIAGHKKALQDRANARPNNPYNYIYLADIAVAEAIKPILDGIKNNQEVSSDNPETMAKLDEALALLERAQKVCEKQGYSIPNESLPLFPHGLDAYSFNPDAYWGGALAQAWQREVALTTIQRTFKSGWKFEIP